MKLKGVNLRDWPVGRYFLKYSRLTERHMLSNEPWRDAQGAVVLMGRLRDGSDIDGAVKVYEDAHGRRRVVASDVGSLHMEWAARDPKNAWTPFHHKIYYEPDIEPNIAHRGFA